MKWYKRKIVIFILKKISIRFCILQLNNFVKSNYLEASIVATGMNHEELKLYAGALKMSEKPRNVPATKFYGGSELRKETRSGLAYVALAIEGAS